MTLDLKIGYHRLPLVETLTLVFLREALAQLGVKRTGGRTNPSLVPLRMAKWLVPARVKKFRVEELEPGEKQRREERAAELLRRYPDAASL